MGAALALCWAIPAAIEGGKEFADKIFWGQNAGRMVKAFDHQRPFIGISLFYLFLPSLGWLHHCYGADWKRNGNPEQ